MGRENCQNCELVNGEMFCSYFDFAFRKCTDVNNCPDGLDDDDDDEECFFDYSEYEESDY